MLVRMANSADEVSEHMRAVASATVITRAISTIAARSDELTPDQLADLRRIAAGDGPGDG